MRHWRALLLGCLSGLLLGCASGQPSRTTSWLDRFRQGAVPRGADVVHMEVALVERPLGDGYLNRDLWAVADEQVVPPESKAILEDNGFRVAQIGGITPVDLQTLLTSKRSCANPQRIVVHAGQATPLVLGPAMPVCRFEVERDGEPVQVSLEQAQCTLEVVPSLAPDGHTRLRFVPQVFHGEASLLPKPAADLSGWVLKQERPTARYAQLAWEVSLAPNEYVVIGGRFDRPQSLGHQCFVRSEEATPVQRLLVIRTGRPSEGIEPAAAPTAEDITTMRSPPLAYQAAWVTARGSAP